MREGASLKQASREVGIDPRTVERLAGSALKQARSGRYAPREADRLQREVRIPSADGLRDVTVPDSKQASLVGEYWNEVHAYLAKGDASGLARFAKLHVTDANGERVPLLVDRDALDELGNAGVLSFESIYARGVESWPSASHLAKSRSTTSSGVKPPNVASNDPTTIPVPANDHVAEPILLKGPDASDKEGRRREFLAGLANNEDDRWSEHGLGHLLNPIDPDSNDRDWIAQVWRNIVRRSFGLPTEGIGFESAPAVGQVSISSPHLLRPFKQMNRRKHYQHQVKPFNFLSTCHVRPFGHPYGSTPERFQLIAPYESDSRQWLKIGWTDRYSGNTFRIRTTGDHGARRTARVKTYGDVIEEYESHPESKCADATGKPSGKQTLGLLQRRHVRIDSISAIGKESNNLEEVEAGLVHDEQRVYTEYTDRRRDYWSREVVPALQRLPLNVWERESGKSRIILIDARRGRRRPHPRHQDLLISVARKVGLM